MKKDPKKQLVTNWHIREYCNFGCKYCYAHWPESALPEAWRNPGTANRILEELSRLPAIVPGEWTGRSRLNIAGGEPLSLWNRRGDLQRILDEAERLGFALSVITNGFLLTDAVVRDIAPRLQVLGVSMDSANPKTNRSIGRCDKGGKGRMILPEQVAEIFRLAREVNPDIECKLNTVVCADNWREDFHAVIGQIAPDRWKVFQMLPIADTPEVRDKQQPLVVTAEQFADFKARHRDLAVMCPEDNDAMTGSYVMVDPFGRFYQNESAEVGHRHIVSRPIYEVGAETAWDDVQRGTRAESQFVPGKFGRRYPRIPIRVESITPAVAL